MKIIGKIGFGIIALLAMTVPVHVQAAGGESPVNTVEAFMAAYNDHDVEAMLELVHPEVQWLSVEGDSIHVEADGASALGSAMREYFASTPSSRSTMVDVMEAGRFVSVRERATWEGEEGAGTQSALAVYEVVAGRILQVWYYPAQGGGNE